MSKTIRSADTRMRRAALLGAAGLSVVFGTAGLAAPAMAQEAAADVRVKVDVPAGSVRDALRAFTAQTNLQLVYGAGLDTAAASPGVKGEMTAKEALVQLLSGTGLTFRFVNERTVTIEGGGDAGTGGERVLGAVRVQGAQGSGLPGATAVNGVNGSRDVTATEGTGSYTSNALTIGSKTAATIKDTPASVSVLTNQQIQDQNITDLNGAMRNLPGVTLVHNSTGQYDFYSRGFQVSQFQFDGGAAMGTSLLGGFGSYHPVIDMSLYDHVEIVRGAAGTFNAYGSPGGVVNLVRKKPLDHNQILVEAQVGSWNWYRGSVDITGPIAFDGHLRGRAILTHQDNRFFYDIAKANLTVGSVTLEYDVGPNTLASVGVNYQESNNLPFTFGLMRYEDGRSLNLPRSTCFCFGFAKDNNKNLDIFGQIEQKLGSDWALKLKATRIRQEGEVVNASVRNAVNPYTLVGAQAFYDGATYPRVRQTMIEATLNGEFRLFGQNQKLVVGANYSMTDGAGSSVGASMGVLSPDFPSFPNKNSNDVNPYNFNSNEWLLPSFPNYDELRYIYNDIRTLNAYANFDFTPVKRLHFTTGIRYAQSRSRFLNSNVCYWFWVPDICPKAGEQIFFGSGNWTGGADISWPPSVQTRYDITDNLTVAAVYTDIYVDQSYNLDRNNKPIPPITGQNFEADLKWASPDRRINITLSGFFVRQVGDARQVCGADGLPDCSDESSPAQPGQLSTIKRCCYEFNPDYRRISYGTDIEVAGEIRKGWQVSASYTYNRTYYDTGNFQFDGSRAPLLSYAPRHKFQLWTTYDFADGSIAPNLTLGFGVKQQSSTFVVDRYCTVYTPNPVTGVQRCTQQKTVYFTDPGRVVLSGSVGYKLNKNISLNLIIDNLLDKTYYEQVGGIGWSNWYGAPRNVQLTVRGKF